MKGHAENEASPQGQVPLAEGKTADRACGVNDDASFVLTDATIKIFFENAPDGMVITDTEGTILHVNVEMERMFGYPRHELIGKKVEKLMPERVRSMHIGHRRMYAAKPTFRAMSMSSQLVGLRRDGTEIPLDVSLNPVQSQAGLMLYGIIRDKTELVVAQRFEWEARFERTLSELSAKFVNLCSDRVDVEIESGLQMICAALRADRATVAAIESCRDDFVATHAWAGPAIPVFPKQVLKSLLPWLVRRTLNGEATLARPHSLPEEAQREREYMETIGIKTALIVPFRVGGQIIGGMSCDAFREDQPWDALALSRFQAAANVFANALARKSADERLQRAYIEIRELRDRLESENRYLRREIQLEYKHSAVIGDSAAIRNVMKRAQQVAETDTTVLILGETGTGKELIARTIHEMSKRSKRTMVTTNCASLPATLIESELFGREKGAYTGALAKEIGRFELADQSTIFLDEIGELPPEMQSKLLRILQDGRFERLGSSRTIQVDVRVITATNRDLPVMVKDGRFREDLFYRLNVVPIVMPPLRERIEDIPALVWHFLGEMAERMGRNVEGVHAGTMKMLQRYSWPGNVRELRNVIERNLIFNPGPIFRIESRELDENTNPGLRSINEVEGDHFRTILQATRWRIRGDGGAAEILGLKPSTLEARLKKLNIVRPC